MEAIGGTTLGAVLGSVCTGLLAKWLDVRARNKQKQFDYSSAIRDDLWEQNQAFERRLKDQAAEYEERLRVCRKESDEWCRRYNETRDGFYEQRLLVKRYVARYGALDKTDST